MKLTKQQLDEFVWNDVEDRKKLSWKSYTASKERYKLRHQLLGLCQFCNNPIFNNTVRCKSHTKKLQNDNKNRTAKRRKNNQCIKCGIPLNSEIDSSNVRCGYCLQKDAINHKRLYS